MQQRIAFKSIPISRNRLRFFRIWQRRERAIRSCVKATISAVLSKNLSLTFPDNHKDRTSAEEAVRIWQTVNSGFSPPPQLMDFGQEQMTDGGDDKMATKGLVIANLEMTQSELIFFIFKAPFHMPARKADMKQYLQRSTGRCIGDKELDFLGIFNVAGNNQPMRPRRQAIAFKVKPGGFSLPDHGPFCRVLDVELFPRNLSQKLSRLSLEFMQSGTVSQFRLRPP